MKYVIGIMVVGSLIFTVGIILGDIAVKQIFLSSVRMQLATELLESSRHMEQIRSALRLFGIAQYIIPIGFSIFAFSNILAVATDRRQKSK